MCAVRKRQLILILVCSFLNRYYLLTSFFVLFSNTIDTFGYLKNNHLHMILIMLT